MSKFGQFCENRFLEILVRRLKRIDISYSIYIAVESIAAQYYISLNAER